MAIQARIFVPDNHGRLSFVTALICSGLWRETKVCGIAFKMQRVRGFFGPTEATTVDADEERVGKARKTNQVVSERNKIH